MRAFLKSWLPVLIWMAVIFLASADSHSYQHSSRIVYPILRWLFPHMPEREMQFIHEILRKCCHLTEYAVFAALVFRALGFSKRVEATPRRLKGESSVSDGESAATERVEATPRRFSGGEGAAATGFADVSPNQCPFSWPRTCGTLLIVFLYASSDEFHQRFVPTRTASFRDVLIDTAGGAIGLFIAWIFHWRPKPKPQK